MKIGRGKMLTAKEMKEVVVTRWVEVRDFDIKLVTINFPTLDITLNVAFGKYEEFKKFLKKEFDADTKHGSAKAMAITFEREGIEWHWINIQEMEWSAEDYGTLCHELHHFTHGSLAGKGVTYGEGGEEVFAYLQGYAMELVVRAFVELKKAKNRAKK